MGQYRLGREESSPIRKIQIMATMKIAGMAAKAALTMKTTMEPKDMWMSDLLHAGIVVRLHCMCTLRSVIASMGGPSKVARDYGFSVQQVCNWAVRGVPARVILDNESFAQALYQAGYERKKQAA